MKTDIKKMLIEVVFGDNGKKKGLFIRQKNIGDWSLIEELGVMQALVQQTYNKMKLKFKASKKGDEEDGEKEI